MRGRTQSKTCSVRKPGLATLILYEDKLTGVRGKLTLENILHQLDARAAAPPELWRLDLLRFTDVRKRAAKAASKAHLIFLSLHGNRHLPAEFFGWLYAWVHQLRTCDQALAILLDDSRAEAICVKEILYSLNFLTYTEGVTVFCNSQVAVAGKNHKIRRSAHGCSFLRRNGGVGHRSGGFQPCSTTSNL